MKEANRAERRSKKHNSWEGKKKSRGWVKRVSSSDDESGVNVTQGFVSGVGNSGDKGFWGCRPVNAVRLWHHVCPFPPAKWCHLSVTLCEWGIALTPLKTESHKIRGGLQCLQTHRLNAYICLFHVLWSWIYSEREQVLTKHLQLISHTHTDAPKNTCFPLGHFSSHTPNTKPINRSQFSNTHT